MKKTAVVAASGLAVRAALAFVPAAPVIAAEPASILATKPVVESSNVARMVRERGYHDVETAVAARRRRSVRSL
jgi:hypothetical protein